MSSMLATVILAELKVVAGATTWSTIAKIGTRGLNCQTASHCAFFFFSSVLSTVESFRYHQLCILSALWPVSLINIDKLYCWFLPEASYKYG